MAEKTAISLRAAAFAVVTALLAGLLASLAVRPPGQTAVAPAGSGAVDNGFDRLQWRVSSAFGTNLPVMGELTVVLAERIATISQGAVALKIYEPGELVPPFSITESVKDRKIDAGYTWVGYDQGRIPASTLISSVPFGMEPWEFLAWWFDGGGRALGEALYAPFNVRPILCGMGSPETAGWFREPITTIEDFRGLKIRFAGLGGMVLQRLGASVTIMPAGEIAQALEKGAIDATEFSTPVIDQMLGFDRVAKYNYFPGWHQTSSALHLLVNLETWQDLNAATRELIDVACTALTTQSLAGTEAAQGPVIQSFAAKGVMPQTLSREMLTVLRDVTVEILDEEAHKDASFAKILASQRRFSASYRTWKRLGYLPRDF